jgi:hypothetical protein
MGRIHCHETSVKDYHSTLRNIPSERRSQDSIKTVPRQPCTPGQLGRSAFQHVAYRGQSNKDLLHKMPVCFSFSTTCHESWIAMQELLRLVDKVIFQTCGCCETAQSAINDGETSWVTVAARREWPQTHVHTSSMRKREQDKHTWVFMDTHNQWRVDSRQLISRSNNSFCCSH